MCGGCEGRGSTTEAERPQSPQLTFLWHKVVPKRDLKKLSRGKDYCATGDSAEHARVKGEVRSRAHTLDCVVRVY